MRIVLLGATGFVGSHLLPELSSKGHQCVVLCRQANRCRALRLIPGVELVQTASLDSEHLAEQLSGADAVINLIGILNESGRKGVGFRKIHVQIVEQLLEACRITGVRRLIQFSALNAGQGSSHYLASKGEAEQVILASDFIDASLLRPSVIFGDGDSFFRRFAGLLKMLPVLPLACPNAKMQPVWVVDVARAVALILEDQETVGKTLDLVGPQVWILEDLVRFTAHTMGARRWIVGLPNFLSQLQGKLMDFVPGKPFSSDNYQSLQLASVSRNNALPALGISPCSLKAVVPDYLLRSPRQVRLDISRRQSTGS